MSNIHKNVTIHYGGIKNMSVIFENASLGSAEAVMAKQTAENAAGKGIREDSASKSAAEQE